VNKTGWNSKARASHRLAKSNIIFIRRSQLKIKGNVRSVSAGRFRDNVEFLERHRAASRADLKHGLHRWCFTVNDAYDLVGAESAGN
jgi:hypothetical protein